MLLVWDFNPRRFASAGAEDRLEALSPPFPACQMSWCCAKGKSKTDQRSLDAGPLGGFWFFAHDDRFHDFD